MPKRDGAVPQLLGRGILTMRTNLMRPRHMSIALVALVGIACTDAPTSTNAPVDGVSFSLTNKPALDITLEGEAWVCKDDNGSGSATNFTFAVSVDGAAATNHIVTLGNCVLVASVPTTGSFFARISVTELAPPANWALDNITIESDNAGGNPVVDVPNANAAANISNDQGQVFTFFNTFTPPPPAFCTRTQGFWKNHPELWDAAGDNKPFLTTDIFFNSGVSYLTIMLTPPAKGNAYLQLAHQYIAAVLNTGGGPSGNAAVDAAIAGAAAYFAGAPAGIPNPVDPTRSQLQAWATTLDQFNNGIIGPGHCPD